MSGFLYITAAFVRRGSNVGIHATGDELNCTWLGDVEKNHNLFEGGRMLSFYNDIQNGSEIQVS
jgi:hypothetical protein